MKRCILLLVLILSFLSVYSQSGCVINTPTINQDSSKCVNGDYVLASIGDTVQVCIDTIIYIETNSNWLDAVIPLYDADMFLLVDGYGPDGWLYNDTTETLGNGLYYDLDGDLDGTNDQGDNSCGIMNQDNAIIGCGPFCFLFEVLTTQDTFDCELIKGISAYGDYNSGGWDVGVPPLCIDGDTVFAPLPVVLGPLTIQKENMSNVLNWFTYSELNNQGFEIQYSTNGARFKFLDFLAGAGDTYEKVNYTFEHFTHEPILYYRLKQIDHVGKETYSKIVSVSRSDKKIKDIRLYPNPVNDALTIEFVGQRFETYTIFNPQGLALFTGMLTGNTTKIDTRSLDDGLYLIRLNGIESKALSFIK